MIIEIGEIKHTLGEQSKWEPGTLNEVIIIVTHRNRKTVPVNAKKRRIKMILKNSITYLLVSQLLVLKKLS